MQFVQKGSQVRLGRRSYLGGIKRETAIAATAKFNAKSPEERLAIGDVPALMHIKKNPYFGSGRSSLRKDHGKNLPAARHPEALSNFCRHPVTRTPVPCRHMRKLEELTLP